MNHALTFLSLLILCAAWGAIILMAAVKAVKHFRPHVFWLAVVSTWRQPPRLFFSSHQDMPHRASIWTPDARKRGKPKETPAIPFQRLTIR